MIKNKLLLCITLLTLNASFYAAERLPATTSGFNRGIREVRSAIEAGDFNKANNYLQQMRKQRPQSKVVTELALEIQKAQSSGTTQTLAQRDAQVRKQQADLQAANAELERAQTEIDNLAAQIERGGGVNAETQAQLADLLQKLARQKEKRRAMAAENLQARLQCNREIKELRDDVDEARTDQETAQADLEIARAETDSLREEIARLQKTRVGANDREFLFAQINRADKIHFHGLLH